MHKFKIELTAPNRGKVWIDGQEMHGVKAISFSVAVDSTVEVNMTLGADEVSATGEIEVTAMNSQSRSYVAVSR
jgi:hypothetical protein